MLKDGEVFEAVGYKAVGKEDRALLKLDLPKPAPVEYRHIFSAIMLTPRKKN